MAFSAPWDFTIRSSGRVHEYASDARPNASYCSRTVSGLRCRTMTRTAGELLNTFLAIPCHRMWELFWRPNRLCRFSSIHTFRQQGRTGARLANSFGRDGICKYGNSYLLNSTWMIYNEAGWECSPDPIWRFLAVPFPTIKRRALWHRSVFHCI